MSYFYLTSFSILLSIGQIMFKKAAMASNMTPGIIGFVNPWLIGATILYGLTTILWVWILKTVPLSLAYSFAALGFVLVPIAAFWLFNEPISARYVIGALLIISGIMLISTTGFKAI